MLISMIEHDLKVLYTQAWELASPEERLAIIDAAPLARDVSPAELFTTIAQRAQQLDPSLASLLWDELSVKRRIARIELGGLVLSEPLAIALQMALAHELGTRIDRVIAKLGGAAAEVPQEELESEAAAAGLHWQVVAYAITRENER
jgi:hypothetical protein